MKMTLLVATILLLTHICYSNPWTDEDFDYARYENSSGMSLLHAIIRRQPVFSESESILKQKSTKGVKEPSKALLIFTGIAGILFAGRHIRTNRH